MMRSAVTGLAKQALHTSGYYTRRLSRAHFPGVAVLCYHGVREDSWRTGTMAFEELHVRASELASHCRFIRETCHPISLAQWRAAIAGGSPLPPRAVLVTFDDGYRSVYTLAQPILRRYRIPSVVFVTTTPVERRRLFWFDAVARRHGEERVEEMKGWPFERWAAACALGDRDVADADPSAPLTRAELRALAALPDVELGAHTETHPVLARADRDSQRQEIVGGKEALERMIGQTVNAFAYPNGRPGLDFTADTVRVVGAAGFDFAFTTRSGFATAADAPLERSRFVMLAGVSAAELGHRLCSSWLSAGHGHGVALP